MTDLALCLILPNRRRFISDFRDALKSK